LSIRYAQEEIQRCSGTQFDPTVVEVFVKMQSSLWTELRENIGTPYRLSQLKAV
jgi:response regulator RpfG family c-di-GMP phosphodiesterase